MPRNPSRIYRFHVENLRELDLAITHTGRLARNAIASQDPEHSLRSLLRLYSFLLGAWAETRLQKLLHEEYGFSESSRTQVEGKDTQLKKWQHAVDLAFREHYEIRNAPLDMNSLGVTRFARYFALHEVLTNELKIIIEIRNKLAHGQWIYPFNNNGTDVEAEKYRLINNENLQSLQFKFSLIGFLADTVHDLIVSKSTFERDFDSHFRKLLQVRINLDTKVYADYESKLIEKRERGLAAVRSQRQRA